MVIGTDRQPTKQRFANTQSKGDALRPHGNLASDLLVLSLLLRGNSICLDRNEGRGNICCLLNPSGALIAKFIRFVSSLRLWLVDVSVLRIPLEGGASAIYEE
jgi:hypothetical protein